MKRSFLLAGCIAASMTLFACGDDSGTSSKNVDRDTGDEEISSSSAEEDEGGSDEEKSSSSKKDGEESSSSEDAETPAGTRPATIDDLEKNMVFKGLFGTDVYLATGSKHDLFSLWIPDTAWVAVRSEFKDGVLDIKSENAAVAAIGGEGAIDSMKALVNKGAKISFIVNEEEKLQYAIGDGEYADVEKAQVRVSGTVISSGDTLVSKRMTCEDGDTTRIYSFYEGRYLLENKVGEKLASWAAGYADIQRNYLLMVPTFFDAPVSAIQTASVTSDYNLNFTNGKELKCDKDAFKFKTVAAKDMAQEWAVTEGGLDWTLELKESNAFMLSAEQGTTPKEMKNGTWDVYGDVLVMINDACLNTSCSVGIMGRISDFSDDGFTFNHSDDSTPALPTKWEKAKYE